MRRFITLVQQDDNATVVQAEIENIQRKYGRRTKKPAIPDYPCPFTLAMLGIAYSVEKLPSDDDPIVPTGATSNNILEADIGAWDAGK